GARRGRLADRPEGVHGAVFRPAGLPVPFLKNRRPPMPAEMFTLFWHGPISQWHPSAFEVAGVRFAFAEQFMMYSKALLFGDRDTAAKIMAAGTPREQKKLGREVRNFDPKTWDLFREGIVYSGSYAKFTQDADLLAELLATRGTTLVEASPYDRVWGIGL